jgi:tRNA (guanine37-N1)-methyltransferase
MFDSYLDESILKRAQQNKHIKVSLYNPRDNSKDKHKKVDDKPYGGGPGMILTVQPLVDTVAKIEKKIARRKTSRVKIILFTPGKTLFTTEYAKEVVSLKYTDIILICGRYEGIDSRVRDILNAEEVSIGDYVLTGGELPAMVVIDSISRQIPGVLGKFNSLEEERVSSSEMYTRPEVYTYNKIKYTVPEVLINGDHKKIEAWKRGRRSLDE